MSNAIKIEQDLNQNRSAFAVVQNTAIQAVRLASANVVRSSRPEEVGGELETALSFTKGTVGREGEGLQLSVDFDFRIRRSGDQASASSDMLSIGCSFDALYTLRPGFEPSAEQISAFHTSHAVFSCWPYFREFIQNTVLRMHFPPPPIPYLLLAPKPEESTARSAKPLPSKRKGGRKQTKA